MTARQLASVAVVALAFAYSYVVQPAWDNERAHYMLVRSLAQATPRIDDSMRYPDLRSIDVVRIHGHYYSTKAPGLAAVSVPPYLVLRAAGVETTRQPKRVVWALHLWGVVVPAVLLLLLVRRRADRVEPGFGTAAAVLLGAATLVLPFATVYFSHLLGAALAFGAAAILLHERETRPSARLVFAGGVTAGLALAVEYPPAVVVLALGLLVLCGPDRVRRAAAYAGGVAVGAASTFAFNAWAFGSPLHLPQSGWHNAAAEPLPGLLGVTTRPTLDNALRIVLYPGGIGPILLPALAGAVLLWRRGRRVEAALPVVVTMLLLLVNASSVDPFGGASPGPRFMIAALPFLAVPLACALRAYPGATLGLAVGGALFLVAATLTTALEAWDGLVFERAIHGPYVESVGSFIGLGPVATVGGFLLALAVATAAAAAATRWRLTIRRDAAAAAVALAAWLCLTSQIRGLLEKGVAGETAALAAAGLAVAVVAGIYVARPRARTLRWTHQEP